MSTGATVAEQLSAGDRENSNGMKADAGLGRYCVGMAVTLCLAALVYCSLAVFWPKFSRAEVFFAECAREMIDGQNFVTPLYHGQPFFDKPILVYWLIIGMFKTFGLSHFGARVPSIISALATVLLTGVAGAALFGRRAGLVAASSLATSFMFLSFASLCMSDMLLVFFDSLSLSLVYLGIQNNKTRDFYWLLAAASMGVAFLTKGPIAVVLPALTALIFLALYKRLSIIKPWHVLVSLLIIVLISFPWFLAVYRKNGSEAIIYFFVHENVQRFAGSSYDAGKPFWYPITSFLFGFAPWSIFVPFALVQFVKSWRAQKSLTALEGPVFLWLWVCISVGFFCFSRGKCDYYTLPAYPAAAMLVAQYLEEQFSKRTVLLKSILAIFALAFLVGSFLTYTLVIYGAESTAAWQVVPLALLVAGVAMLILIARNKLRACYAVSAAGICAAVVSFSATILPVIASMEPIEKYARFLNSASAQTRIGVDKSLHGWIDEISFQTGRHPIKLENAAECAKFFSDPLPAIALISEDRLKELEANRRMNLKVIFKENVITHSLTPGYVIERGGNLRDPVPIVMVADPTFRGVAAPTEVQSKEVGQ